MRMPYEGLTMPRKRLVREQPIAAHNSLVENLAKDLKEEKDSGQPLIYERELRPDRLRITVIWDEWDRLPLDERTAVILRAYELAEGDAFRTKIALASGLTVPE